MSTTPPADREHLRRTAGETAIHARVVLAFVAATLTGGCTLLSLGFADAPDGAVVGDASPEASDASMQPTDTTHDSARKDAREATTEHDSAADASCGLVLVDDFDRPDNPSTLTIDGGLPWVAGPPGAVWGIENDHAYLAMTSTFQDSGYTDDYAYVTAAADMNVTVTLASVGLFAGLTFRYSDDENRWKFMTYSSDAVLPAQRYGLSKYVAGVQTILHTSIPNVPQAGDKLRLITKGSVISLFVNEKLVWTVTDTFNENASGLGLLADQDGNEAQFADFQATCDLTPPDGG